MGMDRWYATTWAWKTSAPTLAKRTQPTDFGRTCSDSFATLKMSIDFVRVTQIRDRILVSRSIVCAWRKFGWAAAAGTAPPRRDRAGSDRVGDVHQDVDDREDGQQAATDDGDPADVAPDVGVLLGCARSQRGR